MNPDQPSREEIEARLTALLLGELPDDEARLLRWTIAQDPKLAKLRDQLELSIGLVREVAANPVAEAAKSAPLKFSEERRQKLLAHFQTPRAVAALPPIPREQSWFGSRLVTALALVAVIAVLAAMLLPSLATAKRKAQSVTLLSAKRMAEAADKPSSPGVSASSPATPMSMDASLSPEQAAAPTTTVSPPVVARNQFGLDLQGGKAIEIVLPKADTTPEVAQNEMAAGSSYAISAIPYSTAAAGTSAFEEANLPAPAKPQVPATPTVALAAGGVIENGDRFSASDSFDSDGEAIVAQNQPGDQAAFYRNRKMEPGSDANKKAPTPGFYFDLGNSRNGNVGATGGSSPSLAVPVSGDMPVVGNLFATRDGTANAPTMSPAPPGATDQRLTGGLFDDSYTSRKSVEAAKELTKNGGGALVLNGKNTFPGGIVIDKLSFNDNASDGWKSSGDWSVGPHEQAKEMAQNKFQQRLADIAIPVSQLNSDQTITDGLNNGEDDIALKAKLARTPPRQILIEKELLNSAPPPVVAPSAKPGYAVVMNGSTLTTASGTNAISGDKFYSGLTKDDVHGLNYLLTTNQIQTEEDRVVPKPSSPPPIPQPEILTRENAFSTFSLNVSDVSFKLAAASLENGRLPEASSIRSEEFINAFDYRDPEAAAGQPVAFASERARYPFAQNRDLLRFSIKTAAAGRAANRPLNLVLLLDTSGSMERADRVAITREAMRVLATQLHPQDTVSVVTFARAARLWADGVAGDKAGETLPQVGGITPEGGTNLEEAMRLAYETARRHYLANGINRVVLLTDGAANLGNVDAAALKQKVEAQRKQGIALDCFGIGWEDFNDDMLAELSGNGDGRYAFINTPEEAGTEFAAKLAGALQVAAQDVKVQVEFNPQRVTSWRQIGYAKHQLTKEQFRDNSVLAAEIAAQEAGNALYTVETKPDGIGPVATVYVRYKIPGTMEVQEHSWEVPCDGNAPSLEQSSAAMRLAATAGAFSEWLAASPFAQEVSPDELLKDLSGVPEIYGADQRPKKMEWMIRQAKSLSGK